ncbi:putative rhodanese-like domain-containing protein 19, mitochondrial-like [Capsicum annuum]|nr:putative rhodanese-like domain-containing protein 19, mitochondrial-like [Capsicum annuum]
MPRPSNSTKSDSTMSAHQGLRPMNKKLLVQQNEHMQADIPISPIDQVMQSTQTVGTGALGKGRGRLRDTCSFEDAENEEGSITRMLIMLVKVFQDLLTVQD